MARLIDTSVIIKFERQGHHQRLFSALTAGEALAVSSITASELLLGAERADTEDRRQQRFGFVDAVLRLIPALPFDLQAARVHARIQAQLLSAGQQIGANDLFIAATALAHNMPVLTENIRDFERVPGLVVHRPDW
jgi:tRNA(fMet)-specific endonuclease VapC